MRRLRKQEVKPEAREVRAEPLAEGPAVHRKDGQRDWKSMSDERLVAYAKRFMEENGIRGKGELKDADMGLYLTFLRREKESPGIMAKMGFVAKYRDWQSLSDDELVSHAKALMLKAGIRGRGELQKAEPGVYHALSMREKACPGIMERVGFDVKKRAWGTDEEVVAFARGIVAERGITTRREMEEADFGLYQLLERRKLVDAIRFVNKRRLWKDDGERIASARSLINEKGIRNRSGLEKADSALYSSLRERGLLGQLGLEEAPERRNWSEYTEEDVIGAVKGLIDVMDLRHVSEIDRIDSSLAHALRKRGLLQFVKFKERRECRKWGTDEEVLSYANRFILEKGILNREELKKADSRLHSVLGNRKLFQQIKFEKKQERRTWGADEEVIAFAKQYVEENGIPNRNGLVIRYHALYQVLLKRGLLSSVFPKMVDRQEDEIVNQLAAAMDIYTGGARI
jgi:hypothetical protein